LENIQVQLELQVLFYSFDDANCGIATTGIEVFYIATTGIEVFYIATTGIEVFYIAKTGIEVL